MTRRWYHGTPNRLPVGTVLVPAASRPGSNVYACTGNGERSTVVWITPNTTDAVEWADFAFEMGSGDDTGLWTYEVEPSTTPTRWHDPEVRPDGSHYDEFTCPTATITRIVGHVQLADAA